MIEYTLNTQRRVVLALDTSGSMNYRDALGMRRIDYARECLTAAVRGAPASALVSLVTFGTTLHATLDASPSAIVDALAAVRAGEAQTNLGAALKLILARFRSDEAGEVFVVLDGAPTDLEAYRAALAVNHGRAVPLELSIASVGLGAATEVAPWLPARALEHIELRLADLGRPTLPSLPPVPTAEDADMLTRLQEIATASTLPVAPPAAPTTPPKRGGKVRRR